MIRVPWYVSNTCAEKYLKPTQITQRTSNVRSDIVQAARIVVQSQFGLGDADGDDNIQAQQAKVAMLREGGTRFLYKVCDRLLLS